MVAFSDRVRKAREYAQLSQTGLAQILGVKQQAVQYLENPKNAARGSRHTAAIARACGVSDEWLETGRGAMITGSVPGLGVREHEPPHYPGASGEALQVAAAWDKLSPNAQEWMRDMIFIVATAERKYPWLRRGRPKSETYDEFERRMEQNFAALKVLGPKHR